MGGAARDRSIAARCALRAICAIKKIAQISTRRQNADHGTGGSRPVLRPGAAHPGGEPGDQRAARWMAMIPFVQEALAAAPALPARGAADRRRARLRALRACRRRAALQSPRRPLRATLDARHHQPRLSMSGSVFGNQKLTTAPARPPRAPRPDPHHARPVLPGAAQSTEAEDENCRVDGHGLRARSPEAHLTQAATGPGQTRFERVYGSDEPRTLPSLPSLGHFYASEGNGSDLCPLWI